MISCVAAYYPCLVQLMRCFAYFTTEIDTTTRYSLLTTTIYWWPGNGKLRCSGESGSEHCVLRSEIAATR